MSVPVNVDDRRIDGDIDLARFRGFPIFFFDLEPVLAHTGSALSRDPESLRSVCEQHLGALAASEVRAHADRHHDRRSEGLYEAVHRPCESSADAGHLADGVRLRGA